MVTDDSNLQYQLYGKYQDYYQSSIRTSEVSRVRPEKPKYKYNLFSAFDEGVNTKCDTCMVDN